VKNNIYDFITHVDPLDCGESQESECRFDKCGTINGL
jgi:hypothetical protein